MSASILLDGIIAVILIVFIIRGARRGALKALSHVVSLICALAGGTWVARHYASPVGQNFFFDRIEEKLLAAQETLGLTELNEHLAELLNGVKLPSFLITSSADEIIQKFGDAQSNLISSTASLLAQKVAFIVLFILAFLIILVVVRLLFKLLNALAGLPVLKAINRLAGAILNAAAAVVVVTVLLWLLCTFVPSITADGRLLSDASVGQTVLTQWFFTHMLPLFP